MNARRILFLPVIFVSFALPAFAQIDAGKFANDLLTKYGPRIAANTFRTPLGEMVVDYATNGHVCRIHLPIGADVNQPGAISAKAMDNFLLKLVPLSTRGKDLREWSSSTGGHFMRATEYENVGIVQVSDNTLTRTDVTVTFPKEQCQD